MFQEKTCRGRFLDCFLLPELADNTCPLATTSALSRDNLLSTDEAVKGEAWEHSFINVEQAVAFMPFASLEEVKLVVEAGARWLGPGCDTT